MTESLIPRRSRFGEKLRQELDRQGLSVRRFGRLLDPERPEAARRNLGRWIGGYNQPSRLHRIAVAEVLGLPSEHFLDEDDEEADPVVDLVKAIRRVVREELERDRIA